VSWQRWHFFGGCTGKMTGTPSKTIVFITGAFLGNNCWAEWKSFFEGKGYRTLAPAWPYKGAAPEELRNRQPDAAIALTRLADVTEYFAIIISSLPEAPILIGHSLGGLIVQLLLQRGLGVAGVAIHSFPAQRVRAFTFSFIKEWWGAMGFFTPVRESYLMPFWNWKHAIAGGLSCEQQKEMYYAYAIPESKLLIRDAFKWGKKIDFKRPHAPLLLTSGSHDRMIPAALNYANFKEYRGGDPITEYKEFKGHNHLVFGQSVWREEADYILYWLHGLENSEIS